MEIVPLSGHEQTSPSGATHNTKHLLNPVLFFLSKYQGRILLSKLKPRECIVKTTIES